MPEILYGGAARGGKTFAALMAAAQYVDVPGYSALILRENFADLNQPGGFVPVSKGWWSGHAEWSERFCRWTFPSGATLTFGYLQRDDDVYQYQGAKYQFICIDELTQHTEWRYRYLFSRLTRPESGPVSEIPLRMRATSNPGGRGHEWVKARFIDPATRQPGALFIPARLQDNPSEDYGAYLKSLDNLDPITRQQLLDGDWDAVAGGRFEPSWFAAARYTLKYGDELHWTMPGRTATKLSACKVFGTVDTAASTKTTADYTVACAWAITPRNELVWLDCVRRRVEVPDIVPMLLALYDRWKMDFIAIEGGGTQSGAVQLARRTRMAVKELLPGKADKLVRATPAIVLASSGRVIVPVAAPWLPEALAELTRFTGTKADAHDDIVDCLGYAARILTGRERQGTGRPGVIRRKLP